MSVILSENARKEQMNISVELKSIHDLVMLDTIIDLWKSKWKEDEADDDNDAEDEQDDCDYEPTEADAYGSMFPETAEEKAIRKVLDKLAEHLRAAGRTNFTYHYCGDAIRRDDRS